MTARKTAPPRRKTRSGEAGGQILEALERLLAERPLGEISVDQICAEAGTSRATYYHYFAGKSSALAALGARLWNDVFAELGPFVDGRDDDSPQAAIRSSFAEAWRIWLEHAPVFRALAENWHADGELQELWVGVIGRFTEAIAAEIDRERSAGTAPHGPPSRELATVLLWSTAHALYVSGKRVDGDMPAETELFETVMSIWVRSIYGGNEGHR